MARDSGGTYTLPAGYPLPYGLRPVPSSTLNSAFDDIRAELTDSLSRSGKGQMLANLNMGGFSILAALAITASGAVTAGTFSGNGAALTALNASQLTTGTIPDARVPQSAVTQHQAALALAGSQITSGTIPVARLNGGTTGQFVRGDGSYSSTIVGTLTATTFSGAHSGDGSALTGLSGAAVGTGINAANITTGTIPVARINGGTSAQFVRGDGAYSNTLAGPLVLSTTSGADPLSMTLNEGTFRYATITNAHASGSAGYRAVAQGVEARFTAQGAGVFGTTSNHDVWFASNNTQRGILFANGQWQLNTPTSGASTLVINGPASSNTPLIVNGGTGGSASLYLSSASTAAMYVFFANAGGEKARITISDDGTFDFGNTNSATLRVRLGPTGTFNVYAPSSTGTHLLESTLGDNGTPSMIFRNGHSGLSSLWRFGDTRASGSGQVSAVEQLNSRTDGNATFQGRFGASFWRQDGTAIASGALLGMYAFGGVHTGSTTYNPANHLYAASIIGVAEGNFTGASAMPTGISFRTGSTGELLVASNTSYGTERMRISAAGNVTINAPASGRPLTVANINAQLNLTLLGRPADGAAGLAFRNNADSAENAAIIGTDTGNLTFWTNTVSRGSINSSGNWTLNAPTSGVALTVNGGALTSNFVTITGTGDANRAVAISNTDAGANAGALFTASTSTITARLGATADFGAFVGTLTSSSFAIHTNGSPRLFLNASATEFYPITDNAVSLGRSGQRWSAVWAANGTIQTSDARDKDVEQIIVPEIANAFVRRVAQDGAALYRWRVGGWDGDGKHMQAGRRLHAGFLAQSIEKAYKEVGLRDFGGHVLDEDGKHHLRYDQLMPMLYVALSDVLDRLGALEQRMH